MAQTRERKWTRGYDMRKRARGADRTRRAIIAAAHALLGRSDSSGLTLQEVAEEAGVSRATVYKSVGSRRALLAAVFEDQGRAIGYERVRAAGTIADPGAAIVATVRECCRAWSVMPDALRKTLALAVTDPEVGALVARYEQYRRGELAALLQRASATGALGPDVGLEQASAMLGLFTSFAAFDLLQADVGAVTATEHLVEGVRASLGLSLAAPPEDEPS